MFSFLWRIFHVCVYNSWNCCLITDGFNRRKFPQCPGLISAAFEQLIRGERPHQCLPWGSRWMLTSILYQILERKRMFLKMPPLEESPQSEPVPKQLTMEHGWKKPGWEMESIKFILGVEVFSFCLCSMEITLVSVLYKTEGQMCNFLLPPQNYAFWMGIKSSIFVSLFLPVANYYEEFLKKKKKVGKVYILWEFTSREACWPPVVDRVYKVSSRQKFS